MPMTDISDTTAFLDPDASREYLRAWKANIDRVAEQAAAMAGQLERLRTTARDDNDLAEVTIDSSGVLVSLELTDRTRNQAPEVVARAVMSALQKARGAAARRAQEIAVETMGPGSLSARTTAERMRELLERPDRED
jgi:DNA-binding protein YbaB